MTTRFHVASRLVCTALLTAVAAHAQTRPAVFLAQQGMASWYGPEFTGQRSASGETFDQEQLTAAHRTLPFGTKVRVRRLDSGKSIVVRINDRGPFVGERIIDLSRAAARRIGMTDPGLVAVAVEVVESPLNPVDSRAVFAVQAGTFRSSDNARRTRAAMEQKYGAARIVTVHRDGDLFCVLVGQAPTQTAAESLADTIRKSDKSFESAFVVRLDPTVTIAAD